MKYRLLQAACLVVGLSTAAYLWATSYPASEDARRVEVSAVPASFSEPAGDGYRSVQGTPIEKIRVGERVLSHNPLLDDDARNVPEPDASWRHVTLVLNAEEGSRTDIELLRPELWVEANQAEPGNFVYLDFCELGTTGDAEVIDVKPAPPIEGGKGRVVTGTFKHTTSAKLFDVQVAGEAKPIGVTEHHPFWSVDRRDFVPAGQLKVGETLLTRDSKHRKIISLLARPGPEPVYNLEVHREHVYQVAGQGLLVHNCSGSQYNADNFGDVLGAWSRKNGYDGSGLPAGITFEGTVHRAVNPKFANSAFDLHAPSNLAANHRYSGVGRGGIYSGTSREAVLGELAHYNIDPSKVAWVSRNVRIDNVLDLTNPAVRKQLGVSLDQLTGDYLYPQAIGDLFRSRGYNGILFPSARAPGTSNFVELVNHAR